MLRAVNVPIVPVNQSFMWTFSADWPVFIGEMSVSLTSLIPAAFECDGTNLPINPLT
jgi:hypothetical protein